ncbi:MAG: DegT/DnrJ/EryC1/StrS family aminotransferase [Paracoccaceae bacterium]|nr:DegT/DnrJ/EryC1/StrS family aminotransferase [Paracoccaceae bacterium]MDG2258394.1 DegT/DnrJ/EryC1/StrS family aminotransferase [Paracoccaceae bacterium]
MAVNGGTPVRNKPWIDNYTLGKEEISSATKAIASGYLSKFEGSFTPDPPFSFLGGPYVDKMERAWEKYYGIAHAVSVNSATSGLYAAWGALDIGFGDEVIVPAITMTACAVGPMIYGAIPVFADVDPNTGCIDPDSIEALINDRVKAVLVVHLYGFVADMDRIRDICKKRGIAIVEDCAQSHGAKYKGEYVGTLGDIGIFSLNVNKTIQVGEAGVCVTNNADLAYRLQLIRNHGEAVVGPAGYSNISNILGFNYRLSEVHAAMAIDQLDKLDALTETRLEMVSYLNTNLSSIECLDIFTPSLEDTCVYYQYKLNFDEGMANISGPDLIRALNAEGLQFFGGYTPLYFQPTYQQRKMFKHGYPWSAPENAGSNVSYEKGICPIAESLTSRTITSEHVRPPNTMQDMADIVDVFAKVLG